MEYDQRRDPMLDVGPTMADHASAERAHSYKQAERISQLESELAEARKDAARYRWLRDVAWSRGDAVLYTERYDCANWDDYIDAAMASDPPAN